MDPIGITGILIIIVAFAYAFLRRALLSLTLSICFLAIFTILALTSREFGYLPWSPGFFDLALYHTGSARLEEAFTFFTSMFVHWDLLHLGFNMIFLIIVGTPLEEKIGTSAFAFVFIIGGLLGTLTFYLLHYSEIFVIMGASGALSAELGAYARLYPREKMKLFVPFFPLPAISIIWLALGYLIISSLLINVPYVATEAHIGGLIAGLFIAPLAVRLPSKKRTILKPIDFSVLAGLATTVELRDILSDLEKETVPEVREAWLERFVQRSKCPTCKGPLRMRMGRLVSDCGWKLRLR